MKNNEITFLGRKLKHSGNVDKIYAKDGMVHISSPEMHVWKVLKIYPINELFSVFPYYDFGENYQEKDQSDSVQSSYQSLCR